MASYGINRAADFNPATDAEIFWSYSENRSIVNSNYQSDDITKFLTAQLAPGSTVNPLGGIYNLKLPLDTFNKVGIYNVYIRPKQIEVNIQDVGVLSAYPDIRGIILNSTDLTGITADNDVLSGYRIEYYDSTGTKVNNLFRIITSNNRCEPVNQNIISTTQKSVSYRFNDTSTLLFLTVTPSSATNANPNAIPYIGTTGTRIILSNTFFNPISIEIELTNNDIESLYTSLNGNQIVTLDNGLITTYDDNNNIFSQVSEYAIKASATGLPTYMVKENQTTIDFTQDHDTIIAST